VFDDARYALRRFRQAPGFSLIALATLALGIGTTTAMFTVVNDVLLQPLPYGTPDRLVAIQEHVPKFASISPELPVAAYDFVQWRERSRAFDGFALVSGAGGVLSTGGDPQNVITGVVSGNYFELLGLQPALGRLLTEADERDKRTDVVVLSHNLWTSRFGADAGIVGRRIVISGRSMTVVGVLASGAMAPRQGELQTMTFGDAPADLWRPFVLGPGDLFRMSEFDYGCLARLKPGVTLAQARADLETIEQDIARSAGAREELHAVIEPLQFQTTSHAREGVILLMSAVGAVLLIVCVNLSNLWFARALGRRREFAVRAALGADASRLARQVLTETLTLTAVGGALGLIVAEWVLQSVLLSQTMALPRLRPIAIDGWAWLFAVAVTVGTTLVIGLWPARLSRRPPQEVLATSSRSSTETASGTRLSRLLIGTEVALCTACLIAAGLLLRSFVRLSGVDTGMVTSHALVAGVGLPGGEAEGLSLAARLLDRVRAIPGITAAGLTNKLPLSGEGSNSGVHADDGALGPTDWPTSDYRCITPGYFAAMGIPILRGRDIRSSDTAPVGLLSQRTAERLWPGRDPIGRHFRLSGPDTPLIEVIGTVGDVHVSRQKDPNLTVYVPLSQRYRSGLALAARTAGDPSPVAADIRRVLHELQPDQAPPRVRTLDDYAGATVAVRRFQLELVLFFAAVALLLATLGVYGVVAQSVAGRTREIGVRMALGATRSDVWRLVTRQGLAPVVIGLAGGVTTALLASRLLRDLLFGVTATDPATFATVTATLLVASMAACYVPARRAARVDPTVSLRGE
jgi:predicted permease